MLQVIAWPLVVLVLGIFALLLFKKPVARLIDRTTTVSKSGLVASHKPQEAIESPKASNVNEFLKTTFDNALLVELEGIIEKQVEMLNPSSHEEKEKLLLRLLASTTILRSFDLTYYLIYGSQIMALQHLNDLRGATIPVSQLREFYDLAKKTDPQFYGDYSFEGWFQFLMASLLIRRDGDIVSITVRGKEFLKYLLEQGYTFLKRG